ncbi:MAG: hypothetical protein M0R03_13455 [Novosphingobium sp.]|nr:hypothetical protein [Novosphingobium sp.]
MKFINKILLFLPLALMTAIDINAIRGARTTTALRSRANKLGTKNYRAIGRNYRATGRKRLTKHTGASKGIRHGGIISGGTKNKSAAGSITSPSRKISSNSRISKNAKPSTRASKPAHHKRFKRVSKRNIRPTRNSRISRRTTRA